MMKLRHNVSEFLSFNRAEQRGIAVLLSIITGMILVQTFWPSSVPFSKLENDEFAREIEMFQKELTNARQRPSEAKKNDKGLQYVIWAAADTTKSAQKRQEHTLVIELNGADTLELQRLRGIGSAFARRIVAYRDRLGGFNSKDQLLEVFGMDMERFSRIRDNVRTDTSLIRRVDLNNVQFKELLRHPYFPYELTREIILHRKKIKKFQKREQVREVAGVTDSIYNKIYMYISTD